MKNTTEVKAWEEPVTIPTYKTGEPDKNPMFLEKRVYQGSSGVVYPHAVIDKVYDEKENKEWTALYLENEYLKVMILPQLGGRIQMAYDKTNDYHFIYHNQVIKPALVGLAGPWISGGIEFNWPQHHRPSTCNPVDYTIEQHDDGSKTIWVNEYEIMFRTKCALGFTLQPGKAYIELHAKLHNRTPFPQSFLWWANPAVAVDEQYQSVFPPDVYAVYDHGKRDVSSFPIATGTYYKVDYSPGTDISVYTNIPVPTSYMAVNSAYNFVGGYHHGKKAGMMHFADHHVSPGKKQWTWGCGDFGKAWDRQLTDEDGPYFELMCGVFTDNQPDFSWIMPNEVREFKQYFMPYKNIGYVKNASTEAMVNFDIVNRCAVIKIYVTTERDVKIILKEDEKVIAQRTAHLSPTVTYEEEISLGTVAAPEVYSLQVLDNNDLELISYSPIVKKEIEIPEAAKPIPPPAELHTIEDLFLAGLHLEQYRHATYHAENYYAEALRRDPSDSRNNNALGLLYLRRGEYNKSESYFRKAVEKLFKHNPNPYDGEPLYNLGLSLMHQAQYDEAYGFFFKSTWNAAMQDNAFLQIALLDARKQNGALALSHIEQSLSRNYKSPKARHLKAVMLRKLGRPHDAIKWIDESLQMDHFDFGSRYELYKIFEGDRKQQEAEEVATTLKQLMRAHEHNYIEIAIDYANAGLYHEAFHLLEWNASLNNSPLPYYYMAFYKSRIGDEEGAKQWCKKGSQCKPDRVFPNRLEDVDVLNHAIHINKNDYKAYYYIGNFYYAKKRYQEAKDSWEQSIATHNSFPTALRNLGIAYYNKFNMQNGAVGLYEKAFASDPADSRILFELDQLYKRFHKLPIDRLEHLKKYEPLVHERDDLYIEYVTLHTLTNQFEQARLLLQSRNFHPWEGGEGKTTAQHILAHVELAKMAIQQSKYEQAIELLKATEIYPENLGEGKLYGAQENDIHYWLGCAYELLNNIGMAKTYWQQASIGLSDPSPAIFYNDQQPDKIFYQGLALLKLQQPEEAHKRFNNLISFGKANMNKEIKIDFFAVSLPDLMIFDDDLQVRNNIHCHYLQGLGWQGLQDYQKAEHHFSQALFLDPAHVGATLHKDMTKHAAT